MKAVFYNHYGLSEVLKVTEIPRPEPNEHQILVKVHATTLNRTDCATIKGPWINRLFTGLFKPSLSTTGTDFAGQVEQTGSQVHHFKIGDRVFGFDGFGLSSHAEYLVIHKNHHVMTIPDKIAYAQAAASIEGMHYAINVLNKVKFQAGQKVLLLGATGAIGSALLQLAKHHKAYVVATCRKQHIDAVKALGADRVMDFENEDWTKDQETYDYVFDAVGKSTFGHCKHLLYPKGIYISTELGPYCQNVFLALLTPLLGGKKVRFPIPFDIKASMLQIKSMLETGAFKPLIDKHYTLEEIQEVFDYVDGGRKVGNVILEPQI